MLIYIQLKDTEIKNNRTKNGMCKMANTNLTVINSNIKYKQLTIITKNQKFQTCVKRIKKLNCRMLK